MKSMKSMMGMLGIFAAMGAMHSEPTGDSIAEDNRTWPSNPEPPKLNDKSFEFRVGDKAFTCMATTKKLAIAKFEAWKRQNKLK